MNILELTRYLKGIANDFFEYSFYNNSAEIVDQILDKGLFEVIRIKAATELKKGVYKCDTLWKISDEVSLNKTVTIDITGEMIYITEVI